MILTDTNILLRSLHPEHPHHDVAENALSTLRLSGETLCVAPQNLVEFWAVATRLRSENGFGMDSANGRARNHKIEALVPAAALHPRGTGNMAADCNRSGRFRKANARCPFGSNHASERDIAHPYV